MAETLPALEEAFIRGRYTAATNDTADTNNTADVIPYQGTWTFKASAVGVTLDNGTAEPPYVGLDTFVGTLDADGYLKNRLANNSYEDLSIPATESTHTTPNGFTWTATPALTLNGKPVSMAPVTFHLTPGVAVWLPSLSTIAVNPGVITQIVAPVTSVNTKVGAVSLVSTDIPDLVERIQDVVAGFVGAGSNVVLTYNDAGNTLTIASTSAGGAGLDAEAMRDAIGVALVGVGNIAITVNDAADTITVTTTATVNQTDAVLKARANHTGTQLAATISDFAGAVDARIAANRAAWGDYPTIWYTTTGQARTLPAGYSGPVWWRTTVVGLGDPVNSINGDFVEDVPA